MTQAGKHHFDRCIVAMLAQWGVKGLQHNAGSSPCVLVPADWTALQPARLAAPFVFENCPLEEANGSVSTFSMLLPISES
jgi:hypothetical protein